ncbi:MAG: mycothione reductase [Leucobacter sp.]
MRSLSADLAIIGSGSGNSLVTPYWDDKRVVIAESGTFGGTCLNVGCIPTKMFVRPAALARGPEEAARLGVSQVTTAVDWRGIRDRIFSRIDPISEAGRRYRDVELDNVELVEQRVRVDGPGSLTAADGTKITADRIVIAAGSRAVLPDVPGIDLPGVHTSDTVMRIPELPKRVVIIGGGFIACEFAAVFSGLGSDVVQAVRGDRLLRSADDEIAESFAVEAGKQWTLLCNRRLARIDEVEGSLAVKFQVAERQEERTEQVAADLVLVAVGRTPNSDLVGAAEAGLDLHDDGRIVVDEYQRVLAGGAPVPGMYALGDVCSPWQLKHVANHEARIVSRNLEHANDLRSSHSDAVPAAVFSSPEIAQVGLTEREAIERVGSENVSVKVQRYGDTAYGWAMEDQTGIFKVIADRRDGKILGAHAMGYQASNLIQPVIMAMSFGIDAHTAARGQYWAHPALMEVTENALLGVEIAGA